MFSDEISPSPTGTSTTSCQATHFDRATIYQHRSLKVSKSKTNHKVGAIFWGSLSKVPPLFLGAPRGRSVCGTRAI